MRNLFLTAAVLGAAALATAAHAEIRHIVAFRYSPQVTPAQKAAFRERFIALKEAARHDGQPYIVSILGGGPAGREGLERGFEQVFVVTFRNAEDRNRFVGPPYREAIDPAHLALAREVEPTLARDADGKVSGLFVFDIED